MNEKNIKYFSKPKLAAKIFDILVILFSFQLILNAKANSTSDFSFLGFLGLIFVFVNVIRYIAKIKTLNIIDIVFFVFDILAIIFWFFLINK